MRWNYLSIKISPNYFLCFFADFFFSSRTSFWTRFNIGCEQMVRSIMLFESVMKHSKHSSHSRCVPIPNVLVERRSGSKHTVYISHFPGVPLRNVTVECNSTAKALISMRSKYLTSSEMFVKLRTYWIAGSSCLSSYETSVSSWILSARTKAGPTAIKNPNNASVLETLRPMISPAVLRTCFSQWKGVLNLKPSHGWQFSWE